MEFKEIKKKMFKKNPRLKEEYDNLEPEYKIIEQIIKLRRDLNLTQAELGKLLKVKQPVIARLESGEYNPSLSYLKKVADVLGAKLEIKFISKAS